MVDGLAWRAVISRHQVMCMSGRECSQLFWWAFGKKSFLKIFVCFVFSKTRFKAEKDKQ